MHTPNAQYYSEQPYDYASMRHLLIDVNVFFRLARDFATKIYFIFTSTTICLLSGVRGVFDKVEMNEQR